MSNDPYIERYPLYIRTMFIDFLVKLHEIEHRVLKDPRSFEIALTVISYQRAHDNGITISSLAASLDLPRETVRRKVESMIADGGLARNGQGELFITDKFRSQTSIEEGERAIDLMLKTADSIRRAVENPESPNP